MSLCKCLKCHGIMILIPPYMAEEGRYFCPVCSISIWLGRPVVMETVPPAGNWSSPEAQARNKATAVENGKRNGGKNKIPVVHIPAERKAKLLAALAKIDGEILERRGEA